LRKLTNTSQPNLTRLGLLLAALAVVEPAAGQQARAAREGVQASVADEPKKACILHHVHAQVARREGKLVEARADLLICSRPACPTAIRADCSDWYGEVDKSVPSIVIAARSERGDEVNVDVTLDGRPLTKVLDGKPFDVNPGQHELHFELAKWPAVNQTVLVRAGERNRVLPVTFTNPDSKPGPSAPAKAPAPILAEYRPVPDGVYWLFGGAVLLAANATVWNLKGISDKKALTCAPFCTASELNKSRVDFLVGDLSTGGAILSLGAAAILWATRPTKTKERFTSGSANAKTPGPAFGIRPERDGAFVDIWGQF
jgi:hypothetical protein